ncbi:MAG: ATP-binding protein [Pseudomonadota bacterium]
MIRALCAACIFVFVCIAVLAPPPPTTKLGASACSGLFDCMVMSVGQMLILIAVAVALSFAVITALHARRSMPDATRFLLGQRDWAVAVTGLDGTIRAKNQAMETVAASGSTISEAFAPIVGISATEVYRLSRLAVQDGLALEQLTITDGGHHVALTVQLGGDDTLVWQLIPHSRLASIFPAERTLHYEDAPFAYIRFSAIDDVVTNALFRDVFSPAAVELLRDQSENGMFAAGRVMLPGADGVERLALSSLRIDRSPVGETCEIFLFVPDAETSGQVSAADTLEAIPVSLLHLDVEGRVFWGNAQARKMLGDSFQVGRMLDEIIQPLGRALDGLLHEVRNGQDSGAGEMMRLHGARTDTFVQVSLTHMVVQGQPSLMAVLTDASELRLLEDKFAQSQKMEAVGKLAGGVAHDFNNVLTAISGHCDLLLLRKDASHPDFSDLTQIRQNSNRAATLVRQLLAFSRKQTLQPKLLSVQDVVTDTLYLLDRLIGETITLSLDHGRELGSVKADNQQLEQALMNLVVNARDAMPDGGMVTIATRNRSLTVEEQHLGVLVPAGEYVEISVSDSGTGIDQAVIDKVFDPFFTTKPQGEGTGLGLSTVYGIVKQSGGYIYARNLDFGGACFTILLPRAYPTAEEVEDMASQAELERSDLTGHGAVMLVEDEAPVRSFASRALKLRGYKVIEAESAEDAMDLLNDGLDEIDVLVSDVVMPGMDGPTFASKARQLRPNLKVIFISGYAEDSFRRNLSDTDFMFLSKPFSLNELTAKVKVAMDMTPGATAAE